jgi:hypothetical protein
VMDSSKASTSPDNGHQAPRTAGFVLPPIPNRTAHQQVFLPFLSDEMRRSSRVFPYLSSRPRAAGSELKKKSRCEPFPGRFSLLSELL